MEEEETTVLFRHLPAELSKDEREDLLYHLGARRVQVMGRSGAMKNTAFAVFPNKSEASKIVKQLHQVEFLGSKLKVEFAHRSRGPSVIDNEGVKGKDAAGDKKAKDDGNSQPDPEVRALKFDDTFNAWGLTHPRRPDLYYVYPPPTPTTLTNIMHALAAVPKFYVQVLHLMNKMDLPAPFGAVTSAPPVRPDLGSSYLQPEDRHQREMDISSETESELDSDGEHAQTKQIEPAKVQKPVTAAQKHKPKRKRPRLSDLQDDPSQQDLYPSRETVTNVKDVFDQADVASGPSRRIDLKLPSALLPPMPPASSPYGPIVPGVLRPVPPPMPVNPQAAPVPLPLYTSSAGEAGIPPPPQHPPHAAHEQLDTRLPLAGVQPGLPSHVGFPAAEVGEETCQGSTDLEAIRNEQTLSATPAVHPPPPSTNEPPPPPSYDVALPPQHPALSTGTQLEHGQEREPSGDGDTRGGFGLLQPVARPAESGDGLDEEDGEKEWTDGKFISSSELRRSRLSQSEMKEYGVFRRYNAGEPSCRLYIKNLAKQVVEDDIHWIFGRYVDWSDETQKNIFDIRLMKEGRMKGQAFVTLPSEDAAKSAVKDANGFMLKEKPMVVQFARSAKAQEDEAVKPS